MEVGEAEHPNGLAEDDQELSYLADEAWQAAIDAAGTDRGLLGVLEETEKDDTPAAVRDLFASVH